MTLTLLDEAVAGGARLHKACELLSITTRTVERWRLLNGGDDQRAGPRASPSHMLTQSERRAVLDVANSREFRDKSPRQIVPTLADRGQYVASESTFYRVLHQEDQMQHRARSRPRSSRKPKEHVARAPNQVWCWDITYLRSSVRGAFYYLKYRPGYPRKPFESIDAARAWVSGFVAWYNSEHLHSAIRYVTPDTRHAQRDAGILAARHQLYQAACARTPRRWTGETRNWAPIRTVPLNPTSMEASYSN